MKKLVSKKYSRWFMLLLAIMLLAAGYVGLRYYVKPEWFDQEHIYHKVYNYQANDIEPQKKIIKDLNVEIIHNRSVPLPDDREFKEETREIEPFYGEGSAQLHVTFTDDTQADIPLVLNEVFGPGFFEKIKNTSFSEKLSLRFPNIDNLDTENYPWIKNVLMLYQGDTLYQTTLYEKAISYQLENPSNGELQNYYQYGYDSGFNWKPVYFLQSTFYDKEEQQIFLDDYRKNLLKNYWDTDGIYGHNKLSNEGNSRRIFYSNDFSNLPIGISTTGNNFKMTITESYIVDAFDDYHYRVKSSSKTYTEKNRDEYVTEVLEKY